MRRVQDPINSGFRPLPCAFCEVHDLEHTAHASARCPSCEGFLSEGLLEALHRVSTELPDIFLATLLVDTPASAAAWR